MNAETTNHSMVIEESEFTDETRGRIGSSIKVNLYGKGTK